MPKITLPVNLEDVESGGTFELIPSAEYALEVNNIEQKVGGDSGADYLSFTFKIIDDDDFTGRVLWDNVSLQPQALFKLKQLSISAGIDIAEDFDTEDFLGAVVLGVVGDEPQKKNGEVVVDEDTGNPLMKNVIKGYKPQ